MIRTVEPEILDSLPHDHPDAQLNRRDLVRINRLMGNHRWLCGMAERHLRPGMQVTEPGAGDGRLAAGIAARVPGLAYTAVEPWPQPPGLPEGVSWASTRLDAYPGTAASDALVANLILHQFSDAELRTLGEQLSAGQARMLLACEPARGRLPLRLIALGRLIGFHPTTVHDGRISVRAGFTGEELPHLLGLDPADWTWTCTTTLMGAYRMAAFRR